MTPREIASLWLIALGAVAVIIWQHSQMTAQILAALGGPGAGVSPPISTLSSNVGTNNPIPVVGNEFGALSTFGNVASGDTQTNGVDKAFGSVWDNLMHGGEAS